jgi:hypothetical protein
MPTTRATSLAASTFSPSRSTSEILGRDRRMRPKERSCSATKPENIHLDGRGRPNVKIIDIGQQTDECIQGVM